ncbi:MAG TPA: FKBP-type peptidyl-prolyl cis-trans isomerase [Verrucomicrobiae bacterium]|nr:FKBP-type peptidyl-prolyl cis-trans isomerase [Verrucomicrobiae bacterium]
MSQAKNGDKVRIDYTGTLDDGTVFDSTLEMEEDADHGCDDDDCGCGHHEPGPMELTIGGGECIPQIEEALVGMAPGEKKTIRIAAEEAFGEYDEERVFTVERKDLPEDMNPEVGDELVLSDEDDEELEVVVVEVTDQSITFDANHPLAGEDLTYEVQLLEIL